MKKIFTLSVICLFAMSISAQEKVIRCGNSAYHKFLEATYPDFREKNNAIFQAAVTAIAQPEYKSNGMVYTIPVVVHVVYKNSMENIPDIQIQSQLDVLNLDFRKMNADAGEVPQLFAGLAADAEIEFCLATVDPEGNATTGITRTPTNVEAFTTNDSIKKDITGGKSAWATDSYLNIWVGALTGTNSNNLLGYATGPGVSAWRDGVVVRYDAFGTTVPENWPNNKGRTCTHEVGHYFDLNHIWGDGNCSVDDGISDTPLQESQYGGCPTFGSPSTSSCNSQDMFMNYMDYTYDACMFMFTQEQVAVMRQIIQTERAGLLQSTPVACDPTSGTGCRNLQAASITMGFEDGENLDGWSVVNNNNDTKQWQISEGMSGWGPRTGDKCMAYTWSYSAAADDWFFAPCFQVKTGRDYELRFWYATGNEPGSTYPEKLKVVFSTSPSPDDILGEHDLGQLIQPYNPNMPDNNYEEVIIELPDYEDSEIYIGFQCYSDADQHVLLIDDINIDIIVSNENAIPPEALQIYPNPVSDQLIVDFNFDKTIQNLHINLVDLTGKIIHTKILENYATGNLPLEMSKHPSGVYFLNIQADEQMATHKIVVSK